MWFVQVIMNEELLMQKLTVVGSVEIWEHHSNAMNQKKNVW